MSTTEVSEWTKFCRLQAKYGVTGFSFSSSSPQHGDIYRFGARYSLAADLASVSVNGRTTNTADGYAQLIRTVMAWGVVESYFSLHGVSITSNAKTRTPNLVPLYDPSDLIILKNKLNNGQCFKFFNELKSLVNNDHQNVINDYLSNPNGSYDVSYLFSAIRHAFAHGILTPHTGKVTPSVTVRICKSLITFFLNLVSEEFGKIVRLHKSYSTV